LVALQPAVPAASAFRLALPGYTYQFPRDHGSHLEYATEWWYYTGHLTAADGRRFGYQLTWFRTALAPEIKRTSKWAVRDIYFAHFALTDEAGRRFFFTDRIERGSLGLSGADSNSPSPRVWVGSWKLQFRGAVGGLQTATASGVSDADGTAGLPFALQLDQRTLKVPAIHGERGVSQKSAGPGHASHYYSYTRLQTQGTLRIGDERLEVTGESWFDHEFGSGQMDPAQVGWDWFSVQLDDGRDLMLYRLRLKNGGTEPLSSGTLLEKDGRARHLKLADFRMEPLTFWKSPRGTSYPAKWRLTLPKEGLTLETEPVLPNQELRPKRSGAGGLTYWEGSIQVRGTRRGQPVAGRGYLEMTGYEKAFSGTF
jgi:predicted secreted hydrolase